MNWGEFQSVIQLSVALNSIYLSLKDIRSPAVRNEEFALDQINKKISDLRSQVIGEHDIEKYIEIRQKFLDIYLLFSNKIESFEKQDEKYRGWCLICIFVYLVLLLASAFFYGNELNPIIAIILAFAGFIPIVLGLILNVDLVRQLDATIKPERYATETLLIQLESGLGPSPQGVN